VNAALFFLILTLCTWVGVFYVSRAILAGIRFVLGGLGVDRKAMGSRAGVSAGIAAVLLILGSVVPKELGQERAGSYFPIVWVYTPLAGWLLLLGAGMAIARLIQSRTALTKEESRSRNVGMAVWLVVAALGFWWLQSSKAEISILRGGVPIHVPFLLTLAALLIVSLFVMVRAEQSTKAKGLGKGTVTFLTLLAGAIVFGIPFLWMLTTSFKEERDLANSDGIVWAPKVQLTHQFIDPNNRQYHAYYEGQSVKVTLESEKEGDKVLLEVERPYGLRGRRFEAPKSSIKEIPRNEKVWEGNLGGTPFTAFTVKELPTGNRSIEYLTPANLKGQRAEVPMESLEPLREPGLRWENYTDALEWMPLETNFGLRYLVNTLWLVIMSVIGTVLSCSVVAYGFSRLRFAGRDAIFGIMLATMMLPAAVTMLPQFLIFRSLGWIDTLMPIWVPTFFAGAFNVFLLKQFFSTVPMELEEAARIDGCGYFRTFWQVMLPMVKPALAAISIWTFMGAWNNFMGPLIYVSSPSKMPLSYALGLFASDRGSDVALMMAFATMTTIPVLLLFFFAQKYFIEGVQLSGMGGR